jgi:GNAT superfamily N-acetyltransferase
MAAVSQALLEFARNHRQPPAPGLQVVSTPRYHVVLHPDFPIPGPNSVGHIRTSTGEADQLIDEVQEIIAPHGLPVFWVLAPETEPTNFADFLEAHGVHLDRQPQVSVMVLPIDAPVHAPEMRGLQIRNALADTESFLAADAVNREAFRSTLEPDRGNIERRRTNLLAAGNRRVLLATLDGEPAGSAGVTFVPPAGAIINGGAVRPKFRGRGVYRAMVAARLAMAREAGVSGLLVWGGDMSAPILARLGFETVGWRRFYLDTSAVTG